MSLVSSDTKGTKMQRDEPPLRVLIVDDDADCRDAVRAVLEDEGYEVQVASNGMGALRQLQASPLCHVILIDLMMPLMNGWDFRERQIRDARLCDIPVLVVSADRALAEHARAMDATGYVAKPIVLEDLIGKVRRAAGQRAADRARALGE